MLTDSQDANHKGAGAIACFYFERSELAAMTGNSN